MAKKKSILGSTKPYTNPKYLKAKDKIKKAGPILGGTGKIPKPLDKKFVGCSVEHNFENYLLKEFKSFESNKAGAIPYYVDNHGVVRGLFVKSSNPAYGGDKFMLAKGHVDEGENFQTAAMREAKEECGLRANNIKAGTIKVGWRGEITGYTETSTMEVYIAQIVDPMAFDKPDFEIAETKWLTAEQFQSIGRGSQKEIVGKCFAVITPEKITEDAIYKNKTLMRLQEMPSIAWDFDATLVDGKASEILQQFIKDNQQINHYLLTARSDNRLVVSMFHELFRYPAKLTRKNFKEVLTSNHEKHVEFQKSRWMRKNGTLVGPLTPIEIYEFTIKGKICHQKGIPVLVDDNIARSKMGCDKYGILLIDPLKCL